MGAEGGSRIVWVGHATVLIELDGVRFLTDPLLRRRVAHLRRAAPAAEDVRGRVDAVLISHVHWDHLDLRSLDRLGRGVRIVSPRGSGALLARRGFTDVTEVSAGETLTVGAVEALATHAEHDASRPPFGGRSPSLGYVLAGRTHRVYFAGDTDLFDGMRELASPPLDVALLPVAGWGAKLPPGHLDPKAAADALTMLRPRVAIPIHWATFMPVHRRAHYEPDAGHAFAESARAVAPEVEVRVLEVGESYDLEAPPAPAG